MGIFKRKPQQNDGKHTDEKYKEFAEIKAEGQQKEFMQEAIKLADKSMKEHTGGPFGCVIVKDGKIIAKSGSMVHSKKDCTAHAEMEAIRMACKKLDSHKLTGCDLYTVSAPCPMCFSAIHWAGLKRIFYGAWPIDVAQIGFDDLRIFEIIAGRDVPLQVKPVNIMREESVKAMLKFLEDPERKYY